MRKLFAIAWKDTLLRFASRSEILFFLVLPIVFTVLIGGATGGSGDNRLPVLLVDADQGALAAELTAKRDLLGAGLADAGFDVFMPAGTYFITADIRPLGETDGLAFCRALPERCGVVAVPTVVFYDDVEAGSPLVRFTFCKRREVMEDAVARLKALA